MVGVGQDGVAQPRMGQVGEHRRLHHRHDLAGLWPDHGEAENAIVGLVHQDLHEALHLHDRLRPQHAAHRQLGDARLNVLALSVALTQAHMGKRRLSEHAVGDQPVVRAPLSAGKIVPDDAEVVLGDMRELRAAGAFAERPDLGALVSSRSLTRT